MLPILFDKDTKISEHPAKKYNAFHDKCTHIWLVYIFIPNAISCGGYIFDPSFSQSVSQSCYFASATPVRPMYRISSNLKGTCIMDTNIR